MQLLVLFPLSSAHSMKLLEDTAAARCSDERKDVVPILERCRARSY